MITKSFLQQISYAIIGCAIEVHKELGPGLLESVYESCLIEEMKKHNLNVKSQIYAPVIYKGLNLGGKLKIDLLVEEYVIVEIKAVEAMIPLYESQLLTYLKIYDKPKGLLINFNCPVIKEQIKSMVTNKFKNLDD